MLSNDTELADGRVEGTSYSDPPHPPVAEIDGDLVDVVVQSGVTRGSGTPSYCPDTSASVSSATFVPAEPDFLLNKSLDVQATGSKGAGKAILYDTLTASTLWHGFP